MNQFFDAFLAKFVPRSLNDWLCDPFSKLEQGSMTMSEYEARFHELSRHATAILLTKEEHIETFVKRLRTLQIET